MRYFTGQHPRTIDDKNRIQLPSQLRAVIDPQRDGPGLYVTFGDQRGSLSIFTERTFNELASRIETEFMPGPKAIEFERQFYALASYVVPDKQGRFVLPDQLVLRAGIGKDVLLVGQKYRIDLWNRADFEQALGIDWEKNEWPDWQGFLRMRPGMPPTAQGGAESGAP